MIHKTIIILLLSTPAFARAEEACRPFKVHSAVTLPPPPPPETSVDGSWTDDDETKLAREIGKIRTQEDFPTLFRVWVKRHPQEMDRENRLNWLRCLLYYVKMDADGDGIPDWSAILDREPARVLFPEDEDQNGDGIANVLDPAPLSEHSKRTPASGRAIPPHLRIDSVTRPEAATLQRTLFEKFNLLAIDHTDRHAATVLRELLELLEGLKRAGFRFRLKNLDYVYAFAGHDPSRQIAAYHRKAHALSIGGLLAYGDKPLPPHSRVALAGALAHEWGHAVAFERLTADKLMAAVTKFTGWRPLPMISHHAPAPASTSLYSPDLFQPFPTTLRRNMISWYAATNPHEWFAESFSAVALAKIGKKTPATVPVSETKFHHGARNLSAAFRRWLETFLR